MLASLFRFFKGFLRIKIIGYSPERFINACSFHNIYIWNITPHIGSYDINIFASDFRKLKPIIRKTEAKIQIIEKYGLPFLFFRYRKRKLFFAGFILCLFLIYGLSKYTWNIEFVGNQKYSDEILLNFLNQNGIHQGIKVNHISCSRIVKDIRKEYNDIVWASASIDGCKLVIRVKENENTAYDSGEKNENISETETGTDLIASENGVIKQIITRSGIPLVKEGDSVEKGDVLVTGAVPIYNDSSELTGIQYTKSDADIIEEYTVNYRDDISLSKELKDYYELNKKNIYLHIGDYLIYFGDQDDAYQESESFVQYADIPFVKSLQLPVESCLQTITPYRSDAVDYSDGEIIEKLTASFQKFCSDQEKKGVEIIQNNVKIYKEDKLAVAKGTLVVRSAVGEEKKTTITEDTVNGNDRTDN